MTSHNHKSKSSEPKIKFGSKIISTHPLSARGPSLAPFPDPVHDHDTTRKRGTTRDKGGAPLCPLAPADSRKGAAQVARAPPFPPCPRLREKEARDRYAPVFAPVPSRRTGTRTPPPPPPLLPRERGLCRKARPPFARAMGARQVIPPPASLVHARTIRTRDKPPPPPLPFARKGGEAQERGAARDRTRDAGRRGGTRAHRPFPLLPGTARATPEAARRPPSPGLRAEPIRKRGARAGTRAGAPPHTLSAPPPFARTGGALQPGAAPPSPRVGARCKAGLRAESETTRFSYLDRLGHVAFVRAPFLCSFPFASPS
ncbi:hypothetical protein EDB84DRAFT_1641180 [Lactarius hengduanensis]|nr:hypothetical protein EDB84DRAFT_1641180 [Lactarius hengduanensis]